MKVNIMMNVLILTPAFLLAIFYPQVGTLAALLGSFSTMLVIYFLPITTYLKYKHSTIRNPAIANLIKKSTISPMATATTDKSASVDDQSIDQASPKTSMLEVSQANTDYVIAKDYGPES